MGQLKKVQKSFLNIGENFLRTVTSKISKFVRNCKNKKQKLCLKKGESNQNCATLFGCFADYLITYTNAQLKLLDLLGLEIWPTCCVNWISQNPNLLIFEVTIGKKSSPMFRKLFWTFFSCLNSYRTRLIYYPFLYTDENGRIRKKEKKEKQFIKFSYKKSKVFKDYDS